MSDFVTPETLSFLCCLGYSASVYAVCDTVTPETPIYRGAGVYARTPTRMGYRCLTRHRWNTSIVSGG